MDIHREDMINLMAYALCNVGNERYIWHINWTDRFDNIYKEVFNEACHMKKVLFYFSTEDNTSIFSSYAEILIEIWKCELGA